VKAISRSSNLSIATYTSDLEYAHSHLQNKQAIIIEMLQAYPTIL